ncbi:MAG: hypothetical protein ACOYOS_13450 [Syntrophales bacterium]
MGNWINGAKLINDEGWTPTELLGHIKAGLPCYDAIIDWRFYDLDTLPRKKKTIEEITEELRQRFVDCDPPRPPTGLIEYTFKKQPGTRIYRQDGKVMNFTLPTDRIKAIKLLETILSYRFKLDELAEYKQAHGLHTDAAQQHDTTPISADTPANSKGILTAHLSVAGKKGGSQKKQSKPILEAVKTFMQRTPQNINTSNEWIADKFCKNYNDNKPMVFAIGETKWKVYCSGKRIFVQVYEGGNKGDDKKEKSIGYNTLRNVYVPQAKKAVFSEIPQ